MRTLIKWADVICSKVEYILNILGGICIAAAAFLTTADVLLRNTVNISIIGTTEIVALLLMPIFVFAIPYVQGKRGHIIIEFFTEKCAPKVKKILDLFGVCIGIFLCSAIIRLAFSAAITSLLRKDMAAGAIALYIWPIRLILAIAIAVLLVRLVIDFFAIILEIVDLSRQSRSAEGTEGGNAV